MSWTFTEFATPTKSADYLVAAMVPDLGGNGKEKRHIFINGYCQLKGFQFDSTMEMKCVDIRNPKKELKMDVNFTYGSVCSEIEAVTCAWHKFATPLWFSEIEPFPSKVLAHHFPDIPNLGDMTFLPQKILNREILAPDVLVGGTPCQAFSIAGNRQSLNDERGNLTLVLINILKAIDYVRYQNGLQPCVLVWENVPGVLSTKDNAFGHLLAGLAQETEPLQPTRGKWSNSGYVHGKRTISWRVLNAQYFGLAQRRKRVFLVSSARVRSIAEILIERKSLSRDIAQGETTGQGSTAYIESSFAQYKQSDKGGNIKSPRRCT